MPICTLQSAICNFLLPLLLAQYTPFHHDPKFILEGNWQSCIDDTGRFDEKIFDQPQLGLEVHLGPGDEFAIFKGIQEEHRDHRSRRTCCSPTACAPDGSGGSCPT